MEIGIIGTGKVGSALTRGLATAGHGTVVGSRDPKTNHVEGTDVVTQRAAAEYGDVVVLALPAGVVADVAADLRDAVAGKPVIDAAKDIQPRNRRRRLQHALPTLLLRPAS